MLKRRGVFASLTAMFMWLWWGAGICSALTLTSSLEIGSQTGLIEISGENALTPDNDGSNDSLKIKMSVDAEGELRIIVDSDGDSVYEPLDWSQNINWDDPTDTYYAGKFDYTMQMHTWSGSVQYVDWWGRDNSWRVLPNGSYHMKVEFAANGDFSDTSPSNYASTVFYPIAVQTGAISGTVTDGSTPVSGVRVSAGSFSSWGEALTAADGTYVISGLGTGSSYHVEARKSGYVSQFADNVSVTSGQTTSGQNFTMPQAKQITGTVTLKDANNNPVTFSTFTDRWGNTMTQLHVNINAWNPNGGPGAWNDMQINSGSSSGAYILSVEPGTYNIRAEAEGYASQLISAVTVAADGTLSGDAVSGGAVAISLVKANRVYGTVQLPSPASSNVSINIMAWTANRSSEAWGGGQILSGNSSGTFELRSVLPGTYTVRVEVVNPQNWTPLFKTVELPDIVVTAGTDKDLGTIAVTPGASITGTLTIQGRQTGDESQNVWINCWSPSGNGGFGTQVNFVKDSDGAAKSYQISGLGTGAYNIECWQQGYEMDPRQLQVTIVSETTYSGNDFTLKPFNGTISGTVSGFSDSTAVVVTVENPNWGDWTHQDVAVDSSGNYTITGLGTGAYIIKVNQYNAWEMATNPPTASTVAAFLAQASGGTIELAPDGNFGTAIARPFLVNGKTVTQNFTLAQGAAISGSLTMDATLTVKGWAMSDVQGLRSQAFPIQMQMMGMNSEAYWGVVQVSGDTGTYTIQGVAPGTYIVEPPLDLGFIDQYGKKTNSGQDAIYGMSDDLKRDCAYESQMVTVHAGETKTGVNFTLADGYDVTGTITVPTAPTDDWKWYGELALEKVGATMSGQGIRQSLQGYHFSVSGAPAVAPAVNTYRTSYTYKLRHILPGKYVLRFSTDKFIPASQEIEVIDANVNNINLTLANGANIVGKLVDANTGKPVTSNDGVFARCEARPWVEGSWRGTYSDYGSDTDHSYIDNQTGNFYLKNVPAGSYQVTIQSDEGSMGGANSSGVKTKGYAAVTLAGVTVSEQNVTNNDNIDVGTLKLKEGLSVSGRVWKEVGGSATAYDDGIDVALANIPMEAEPADRREGDFMLGATTAADGTYTLTGLNPDIAWWEIAAAIRANWNERFMVSVPYGEKSKLVNVGVVANRENINFKLDSAYVTLTGTISKQASDPQGLVPFALPPFSEMDGKTTTVPAVLMLLQEKGKVYDDPMEGIEEISAFSDTNVTTFSITDLVPGQYVLKVFCPGFDTIVQDVDVSTSRLAGSSQLDIGTIALKKGGTLSGTVRNPDGTKPSLNDLETVVAATEDFSKLLFGKLLYNSTTREVSDYEIKGIQAGVTYKLVFVGNDGDEITILSEDSSKWQNPSAGVYTYNAVVQPGKPQFGINVKKNTNNTVATDDDVFEIEVFVTQALVDTDSADTGYVSGNLDFVTVTSGSGTLRGNVLGSDSTGAVAYYEITPSKERIRAVYKPAASDTSFSFTVGGHRAAESGESASDTYGSASYTVNTAANYTNVATVDAVVGASANSGYAGDATQVYIPGGALADDGDGKTQVTITTVAAAGVTGGLQAGAAAYDEIGQPLYAPAAYPEYIAQPLPAGVVSDIYGFTLKTGDSIKSSAAVTIGLNYGDTADSTKLNVFYYDSASGYWRKEASERTVNAEKNTVQVNVNHFTDFAAINSNPVRPAAVSATAGDAQVVLSWNAGTPEAGMTNTATGYNIYRSTTSGSGYAKVNSTPVSTATSYTDTGLTNGTTYYYTVRAVDSTQESEVSSEVSAAPAAAAATPAATSSSKDSWYECAIATACYGSPDAVDVMTLRAYRDRFLMNHRYGQLFVSFYYRYSPAVADYIRYKPVVKMVIRAGLKPLVLFAGERLAQ